MPTTRFIITGRVQGVGFRYFVLRTALETDVKGEVWNRRDGGVETIAYHESTAILDQFESELKNGPGRVDNVLSEIAQEQVFDGFRIGDSR
jgi:acylphosphatase